LSWQESKSLELEGDYYYFANVFNWDSSHYFIEFDVKSDYILLTPEMSKFRLLPRAMMTMAAKLKDKSDHELSVKSFTETEVPTWPLTPEIPIIIALKD